MAKLLSMPITPVEVMLSKIAPYVIVGFVQAALIIGTGGTLLIVSWLALALAAITAAVRSRLAECERFLLALVTLTSPPSERFSEKREVARYEQSCASAT
jgi:ABC-type Na+ efflux pump permease subunit